MPDILHRVGIKETPERVYDALSTIEGLSHWWIVETTGETQKGGIINFGFCDMTVVESKPGELVIWKCMRGPKDWIGTEVSFQLKVADDQVFVLFKHAQWKEPVEFMHHCSTKWAVFLLSLRDWIERGEGRPSPYDRKIHSGD
jgi:hypothetical protein